MAYLETLNGLKGRRSDTKAKTGNADNPLNFALAAGAVGLGIALLESEQAAANSDVKPGSSHDDRRVSDTSAAAEQTRAGVDHSATADHPIHNNANNGPAATSGGEVNAQATGSLSSESSPDGLPRGAESAHSSAAAVHGNAGSSAAGALIGTALADDGLSATTSHSSSGEGGLAVVAHTISAITDPLAEALAPVGHVLGTAESVLEPVADVANSLLGHDGLLGHGGVLDIAPGIAETVESIVAQDGILGSLIGDNDSNILNSLVSSGKDGLGTIVAKDGILGSLVDQQDSHVLSDLTDAGKEGVDGVVGKDGLIGGLLGGGGVLSGLTGGHDDTSGQSVNNGGHNSTSPAATVAHESTPAPAAELASAPETAAATTHAAAAETPTDMFAATHAALQITEGVAHALTPILTFVGQPIIDDGTHTDTDHSNHASTHHAA